MANAIVLFLVIIWLSNILTISAYDDDFGGVARGCHGNSTKLNNSINLNFQNNVYSLLSVLVSYPTTNFFNTSVGDVAPRAYGSYLCRGDLSSKKCHQCVVETTKFLSSLEIDYSDCFGLYSNLRCIIRYANSSKFSLYEKGMEIDYLPIGKNVTNLKSYNETLSKLFQGLIKEAGYGNWSKASFATRTVKVPGSQEKIYILVQCTPDISPRNCSQCLGELYSDLQYRGNYQGAFIAHANCLMKYDNRSFFGAAHRFKPSYFLVNLVHLLTLYNIFTYNRS